jgi:hypothetical protein
MKRIQRGKGRHIKQNRPSWRKIRGWGKKLVRKKDGSPAKDSRGRFVYNDIKVKTKDWERVT